VVERCKIGRWRSRLQQRFSILGAGSGFAVVSSTSVYCSSRSEPNTAFRLAMASARHSGRQAKQFGLRELHIRKLRSRSDRSLALARAPTWSTVAALVYRCFANLSTAWLVNIDRTPDPLQRDVEFRGTLVFECACAFDCALRTRLCVRPKSVISWLTDKRLRRVVD